MFGLPLPALIFIGVVVLFVFSAIKILREYQRGVIFLLGRFWKVKGPGLIIVIPGIQKMVRVDLRVIVMDVPTQDVISRDNVSVKVNAVLYFRIIDPEKAIIQVEDWVMATSQLAQTTLRSVLGRHELDDMLAHRQKLNADIQAILDENTAAWGIKVSHVELKQLDLDERMATTKSRVQPCSCEGRYEKNCDSRNAWLHENPRRICPYSQSQWSDSRRADLSQKQKRFFLTLL